MDFTSRMVALLGELRRERNGAVADAMRCYGAPYGLNYGVSLPTLRKLARAETPDHDFARYLYLQEVRELRLAALHIARPESLTPDEFPAWAAGIVNSEVAEEAAFAFLSRSAALPALFDAWIADPNPLLRYAALHSAARSDLLTAAWIAPAVEAVRRAAVCAAETLGEPVAEPAPAGAVGDPIAESSVTTIGESVTAVTEPVARSAAGAAPAGCSAEIAAEPAPAGCSAESAAGAGVNPVPVCAAESLSKPAAAPLSASSAARLIAQGAVALLSAVGGLNEENRQAVLRAAGSLGKLPAEDYVHEELTWRLEV
ncbi:DNA alkylation repair protein [uncultured Alistipes sp.]|uniref:DNA alkylation repair protein n=1 Tax=uncultured Alistipes sp. TaxID=538949 RepID=UPI002583BE7A|nr:DNA alkylation repair protein [uncultured Alistipes sp.]